MNMYMYFTNRAFTPRFVVVVVVLFRTIKIAVNTDLLVAVHCNGFPVTRSEEIQTPQKHTPIKSADKNNKLK